MDMGIKVSLSWAFTKKESFCFNLSDTERPRTPMKNRESGFETNSYNFINLETATKLQKRLNHVPAADEYHSHRY
jgi:hypothetical protein